MRLDHPVFRGPSEPVIATHETDTPESYRRYPEGRDLPARIQVWSVQQGKLGEEVDYGLVSPPWGFEDSPDAETISSGINSKGPTSVALGRQANLFLWGFAGDPTQMTESGRKVFVNVLCYMDAFDGQRLLVRRESESRDMTLLYAGMLGSESLPDDVKRRFRQMLPKDLVRDAGDDVAKLESALRGELEYVRKSGERFEVDGDAKALGISNRSPAMLQAISERLDGDAADEVARRLLASYLPQASAWGASELRAWMAENRDRMFFSDIGGYRWFVDTNPAVGAKATEARTR
jgi:hypothetical protein